MGTDERTRERERERGSKEVRRDSTRCGWYVIVIMISARESDLLATVCLGCTWLREVITQAAAFQAQAASPLGVATRIYLSSIHYTQCGAVHYLQKRRASFFLCKKKRSIMILRPRLNVAHINVHLTSRPKSHVFMRIENTS